MATTIDSKIPQGPLAEKWSFYKSHQKLVNPANKRRLDIIVVDTGLAGASAAASLGELITAGLHVPDGFVITTNAYNAQNDVSTIIAEAERTFDSLSLDRVAVRSSAVGEDAGDSSWAGQLDTVLNVTREGLKDAIEHCWQSMQSSRAQAYAKDNNISKDEQSVAVVIQKMVDADVAGVAFTVNPVNGDQNQLIIEAIYGLGELLVQGNALSLRASSLAPPIYPFGAATRHMCETVQM